MFLGLEDMFQDVNGYVYAHAIGSITLKFSFSVGTLYILWRIWAFTLLPILRPHEPPELPYWIPGHAFSFIGDSQALVSYGKTYFRDSSEPFALTVGGKKLYVVTSATDVSAIYKNNTTLSWDSMINDLLIAFGIKSGIIPKLWQKPDFTQIGDTGPRIYEKCLSPLHATLNYYKKQLLPGERLEKFSEVLFGHLIDSLCWDNIRQRNGVTTGQISLKKFCGEVLVEALTRTMFGSRVLELEPNLVQSLLDFSDDAWMLVFQYPQSPGSKLHKARRKLLDVFVRYIRGPEEMRSEQAWMINMVIKDLKAIDMCDEDRAPLLLMIYWGGNINPYKFAFWMISYILFDPSLLVALQNETHFAIRGDNVDLKYLMNNCPHLDAVFLETLRVNSGALSARKIIAPTPLGNRVLGSGHTILIPLRQLHYDRVAFGTESDRFDSKRFLRGKDLRNSPSFRPFGGGASHCPGQILAKQEMFVFVALILNRFDIKLATGGSFPQSQVFPKLDECTPSLGVNGPVKGSDVLVDFRRRDA